MIKKALVIAPHPDDEINLAGQLIIKMNKLGIETYVLYTTNGDAEPKIGNKRIGEAIKANSILGIPEDHVIFLGYPNEWQGDTHIYNASENEVLISRLGKKETNSILSHPEFCFSKLGIHHKFTRANFKNDLKTVIESVKADLLIAPEFDSHPDHRAASLMFDEVLGEILKENIEYRPIVLKKYIHEGVWYGPKDYYQMLPTVTEGKREYAGGTHDLDSPCFNWEERISIAADEETVTPLLKDNIVYKAAKEHKVTTAWYEMQRVLNSNIVYWLRRTDNLALKAEISASSGDVSKVNDFKLYDCNNMFEKSNAFGKSEKYCWIPDKTDTEKKLTIKLNSETALDKIVIYEDCNASNHILKLGILVGDKPIYDELDRTGGPKEILLNGYKAQNVTIQICEWKGIPGISEIEIYSKDVAKYRFDKGLSNSYITHVNGFDKIAQKVEHFNFLLLFLLKFKLKYELNKRISVKNK